jgi:hypothetical protein
MSVAMVGVGVMGASAIAQSDAARHAANVQGDAAKAANDTQRYQYDTTRADNAPYMERGNAAGNKLQQLLGLSGDGGGAQSHPYTLDDFVGYNARIAPQGYGVSGQRSDANDQYALYKSGAYGNDQNTIAQRFGFDPSKIEQQASMQADPSYGSLLKDITEQDIQNDPVYSLGLKFGLDEGRQGIERQASAGGGMLSGATLKALEKYGTDYATTKAGDAYSRITGSRQNKYNMLAGVSGTGQTANQVTSSAGQNYADNVSQNQLGVGNARAASAIGSANAFGNALGQGVNFYQQNQLLKQLQGNSGYSNWLSNNSGAMSSTGLSANDLNTAF